MTPPNGARILILRHGHYPSDPRIGREARALAARGHRVRVLCLRQPGEPSSEVIDRVEVRRLPWTHRRGGLARYALEYGASLAAMGVVTAMLVLRRRVDLVQVNTLPDWLVAAALAAKLARIPVVLDLHEVSPELAQSRFDWPGNHPAVRILAWLEQSAIRSADACLAVSEACLERYVERGANAAKFTVVMNSPDAALFGTHPPPLPTSSPVLQPGEPDSASSGRTQDAPLVVTHGTLAARYGADLLVHAAAIVTEARFVLYGEGEARPALESLVSRLGLADRVQLAGAIPHGEVAARIAAASVGVVANRSDAFTDLVVPTKLLEYAALGVPAVASATPAIVRLFDEDEVVRFRPGDAHDLARAIRVVLGDPATAEARVARARARVARDYRWPVQAARYVGLVEHLIAARRAATKTSSTIRVE